MKQWEYKIEDWVIWTPLPHFPLPWMEPISEGERRPIKTPLESSRRLIELGLEGWECFAVFLIGPQANRMGYHFKREVPQAKPEEERDYYGIYDGNGRRIDIRDSSEIWGPGVMEEFLKQRGHPDFQDKTIANLPK